MKTFKRILLVALATAFLAAPAFADSSAEEIKGDKKEKSCNKNKHCAADEYCNSSPQCPSGNTKGSCTTKPTLCPRNIEPVIGCDGKEYQNACSAAANGQSNTGPVN